MLRHKIRQVRGWRMERRPLRRADTEGLADISEIRAKTRVREWLRTLCPGRGEPVKGPDTVDNTLRGPGPSGDRIQGKSKVDHRGTW